jgi:phosphoribosyl-dephospho-CoA transferase
MAARLRRHELVWLSREGWLQLLAGANDEEVSACLRHWCEARLPLVVGRQEPGAPELALGLPTPIAWGRRKVALRVARRTVLYHDGFPRAGEIARLLPLALRARWAALIGALAACTSEPRVHGSYGWQRLTGLRYLRPGSDIDLLLPVHEARAADEVAGQLAAFLWAGPRIDGELVFPDGSAVAWREWLQWRRAAVQCVLVKRIDGVRLEQDLQWLQAQAVPA